MGVNQNQIKIGKVEREKKDGNKFQEIRGIKEISCDLLKLNGFGEATVQRLNVAGIYYIRQLVVFSKKKLIIYWTNAMLIFFELIKNFIFLIKHKS